VGQKAPRVQNLAATESDPQGEGIWMRLFVAIEIPSEIRGALAAFLKELRAIAPQAKWVRADNLHVTLKFLGEVEPSKFAVVRTALAAMRFPQAVALDFRGLGFFPNEKRPRVFWTRMEASPNLAPLAADIDQAMHKLGFSLEERPFTPHLTLARFNPPGLPPKLLAAAQQNQSRSFGSLTTREFHLIESKLRPTGAEYTNLQSFPFVSEN
jgi:2'-5' RNA ligase